MNIAKRIEVALSVVAMGTLIGCSGVGGDEGTTSQAPLRKGQSGEARRPETETAKELGTETPASEATTSRSEEAEAEHAKAEQKEAAHEEEPRREEPKEEPRKEEERREGAESEGEPSEEPTEQR